MPLIKNTNPGISKTDLLNAIYKERQPELFSEWGNRWFDLKRTNRSMAVLAPIKPKWKADYVLFPIPKAETDRNPNISQNNGY
ncbi:SusD family protein [compost metagenome]